MVIRTVGGLLATILSIPAFCVPFITTDPVSLGMGGTGTAGGRLTSGPFYNPAMLSFDAKPNDHFVFSLNLGVIIADRDKSYQSIQDLTDDDQVKNFENDLKTIRTQSQNLDALVTSLTASAAALSNPYNGQATAVQQFQNDAAAFSNSINDTNTALNSVEASTSTVINSFSDLDKNTLRGTIELGITTLFPDQTLAIGLTVNTRAFLATQLFISNQDLTLLRNYVNAAKAYTNQAGSANTAATTMSSSLNCGVTSSCSGSDATTIDSNKTALTSTGSSLSNFNYGGSSTPADDGDTVIFQNGQLSSAASDPTLTSSARAIGVGITELGLTLSKPVVLGEGVYHVGITPKYQKINIFDYTYSLESSEDFDFDDVSDSEKSYRTVNVDAGAIRAFGSKQEYAVGLTLHDIVPNQFKSKAGFKVRLDPALRLGGAYLQSWYRLAVDIDLTRNQPVGTESRTQYLAAGAEVDLNDILHLRGGYRTNLSQAGESVVSVGLGITPFFDIAALITPANIKQELGLSLRLGMAF